jgi:nucleotide-binding universal stress UspA family protein
MLNIRKILLPVDFPSPSLGVVRQAATLAHHFHSEIVVLHVAPAKDGAPGIPQHRLVPVAPNLAAPDLSAADPAGARQLAEMNQAARKDLEQALAPELEGLTVERIFLKGDPARAIVESAQAKQADLIMMRPHGRTFNRFLLGSVTPKVLQHTECPVWTGAHIEEAAATQFAIRSVLCAINLDSRSDQAVSWAAQLAAEFGARLTITHVTSSVELWGPGGSYVDQKWKEELVGDATQRIAKLQQTMGTKADVIIANGDVPKALSQAAQQTNADLLVLSCYPYGGNLRIHGYPIICAVPIPVLSV